MTDFDELYNSLYYSLKNEFPIMSFQYSKNGFDIVLDNDGFKRVTTADIVVFNHKTKQYRVFKHVSDNNGDVKVFKCGNISLTIRD